MREHDQGELSKRTPICRFSLASVDAKLEICLVDEIGAAACTPLRNGFQSLQMHYDEQMLSCVVSREHGSLPCQIIRGLQDLA